jgi:putative flippase GtrA
VSIRIFPLSEAWCRKLRFIAGGAANTAFTYVIYLLLKRAVPYQVAYLAAYCCGVVFAYWFNAIFVFRVPLSWKGAMSYPVVYVVQYGASAALLELLVRVARVSVTFAPLIVTACMVPLTYVMSKVIIEWSHRHGKGKRADAANGQ